MKTNRQAKIVDLLSRHRMLRIEQLCELTNVSPATIRRDLHMLAAKGCITRINGGAIAAGNDPPRGAPSAAGPGDPLLHCKQAIANVAAGLVREGDTIFIDAGSTNLEIAKLLCSFNHLSVITNGIEIAYRLFTQNKNIKVFICGGTLGEVQPQSGIIGPLAEQMISRFRANWLFLGTAAIDIHKGVTDPYLTLSNIKKKMIENANKVVLVADHSKFGKLFMAHVCSIDMLHHVITDNKTPRNILSRLGDSGIDVSIAEARLSHT